MLPTLLLLTLAFAILTWRDLHKGLWVLITVLPSYLLRADVFGIPTTLLELLLVTFLVIWFIKRKTLPITKTEAWGVLTPIILLLLAATISIVISPNFVAALGIWKAYFLEPVALFFVIRYEILTNKETTQRFSVENHLFLALGTSALIVSTFAIVQWFTGAGLPIPWDIERRVTSVFDYPNALGLFLGPITTITVLSITRRSRHFWFWLAVASISCIAIILAQSEAAIVSVVATLLIAGFLNKKTRVPTLSLCVLLVLIVLLVPPVRSKLTLQDYSGQVRLSQWSETVDMLGDHWLLGAGLSGYPIVFEPYHQATHLEIFQYPHTILLNIWVELGLIGVIAVGLLVITTLSTTYHLPSPPLAFFALVQMTIHGLVDVPYFKNDLAILTWVLLAIVLSYAHRPTSPTPKKP